MAKRKSAKSSRKPRASNTQAQLLEVLHQIWLAGLGAVSKAQQSGPKLLNDLVAEGARVHSETRGAAEKALRRAFGDVQSTLSARAAQVRGQAADAFENLEEIFRSRVYRALTQLGVPSAEALRALSKRVETLNASIDKLAGTRKPGRRPRAGARRSTSASRAA